MHFFELDERLSNILHAIAAIPFGFAMVAVAASLLMHVA